MSRRPTPAAGAVAADAPAGTRVDATGETEFPTPLGTCRIAWSERGITGFRLPEIAERAGPAGEPTTETAEAALPDLVRDVITRVRRHFAGQLQDFADVPLDWSHATEFQRAVYRRTVRIPAGRTASYGEIAAALALGPEAARAVGVALATNPWPLLVPCHRVVAASGKMTGFSAAGGVRSKVRLLALEGAELLSE